VHEEMSAPSALSRFRMGRRAIRYRNNAANGRQADRPTDKQSAARVPTLLCISANDPVSLSTVSGLHSVTVIITLYVCNRISKS